MRHDRFVVVLPVLLVLPLGVRAQEGIDADPDADASLRASRRAQNALAGRPVTGGAPPQGAERLSLLGEA
eukprot:7013837-Pyramimonas_sp.AAC.1